MGDDNGGGDDDDNDDNNWKQTVKLSLLQFHRLFLFVISRHLDINIHNKYRCAFSFDLRF